MLTLVHCNGMRTLLLLCCHVVQCDELHICQSCRAARALPCCLVAVTSTVHSDSQPFRRSPSIPQPIACLALQPHPYYGLILLTGGRQPYWLTPNDQTQTFKALKVVVHPKYQPMLQDNDVAVVFLDHCATLDDRVQTVQLATKDGGFLFLLSPVKPAPLGAGQITGGGFLLSGVIYPLHFAAPSCMMGWVLHTLQARMASVFHSTAQQGQGGGRHQLG